MISVLLPSRGRPGPLADAVASLRDRAAHPERLEILIAADNDDPDTAAAAHTLGAHCWTAPQRYGYTGLHRYVNQLAAQATGEWLMLFNDDARMITEGWDLVVLAQEPGVLWPQSNDVPGCNTFPLWPRAWTSELGHVSLSPHCDSWIQHLGEALDVQRRIHVRILHDRADLTGGHNDTTRAESLAGYRTADYHTPAMQQARDLDVEALRALTRQPA